MESKNEHCITYRYLMKRADGSLCVAYNSAPMSEHELFAAHLRDDDSIVSICREYICEYDISFVGKIEPLKTEKKEEIEHDS